MTTNSNSAPQETPKQTQTEYLYRLTNEWDLFHDDAGKSYATIKVGSRCETWPVTSKQARDRLMLAAVHGPQKRIPNRGAVDGVLDALDGTARLQRPERPAFIRIAGDEGALYLDLCDEDWRVVRIDADGWRIDPNPPVRFVRKSGMLALPVPMPGGSIQELRPLVNGRDEIAWRLMVAWLLACFQPHGPYPCLFIYGGEGCLKTGTSRLLRSLIDPNKVPLRDLPSGDRDLAIAGANSRILAFDNVSSLTVAMSDAFCRVATGGGLATRQLYTDDSEILIDVERPLLANGIERFVTRPDLLDRAVLLDLPEVPEGERRPRGEVEARFADAHPRILGALLDVLSGLLRELSTVKLAHQPRMADFVRWVTASEPALGWDRGSFQKLYERHLEDGRNDALDSDVIFPVIQELLEPSAEWTGTMKLLLSRVREYWASRPPTPRDLPKTVQEMSGRLKRLTKTLGMAGIGVQRLQRSGHCRPLVLRRTVAAEPVAVAA